MKKNKKFAAIFGTMLAMTTALAGCGKVENNQTTGDVNGETQIIELSDVTKMPTDGSEYIELAMHVYYNDSDNVYYTYETGSSIYVQKEGQYTLSFDCATDLSDEAKNAGVTSLSNLTAIYVTDEGVSSGKQSSLTACDIMWDKVVVDGNELTITQESPKSAFKSSGIFDTNDPINAWEGSMVEEVSASADHVANFTTVTNPTTIEITFTLSNMIWGASDEGNDDGMVVSVSGDYINKAVFSDIDFTNMDAREFTKYLGNGINLGNTMEATLTSADKQTTPVASFESAWGQPKTTQAMIQSMKNCGFDTIRIPVAWTNVMDYENDDYTIREDFVDRVEEIVNYALDAEMFVIINDHWDHGWWAMFGSSKDADVEKAWTIYEKMWSQIAERFADYGDMLIFESANEELGDGLNNNASWAASGSLSKAQQYELTHDINQKFVDIVRASGGNNNDRFLLIAGYNTDIDKTCDPLYVMPSDAANGKLLLSVHYYTPWGYCGDNDTGVYSKWGIKKDFQTMDEYLKKLARFTDKGYGIIIGEWGALPVYDTATKSSYLKDNTVAYSTYFLNLCTQYNYCPVLWSTGDSFNKSTLTMISEEMTELFTSHSGQNEMADEASYTAMIEKEMADLIDAAPEVFDNGGESFGSDESAAYIMWNGGAGSYNVGDTYTPSDCATTIIPHDVIVDGAGEYSVSLEFPGGNDGLSFGALALNAGEANFPGAILDVKSIVVTDKDGKETTLSLTALPYTSSDDGKCTRVNLINSWVNEVPADARNKQKQLKVASPVIVDANDLVGIYSITITFELITK